MTQEEAAISKANAMAETYGEAPGIDLSKIKNIQAAKKTGTITKEAAEKTEELTKKAKKSKYCFTEEHEIQIPSKGYLYQDCEDEDIKNGIVRLQPMSLADEEILANQTYIKNGTVFTHLLNSCMLNNFDARDFIAYDAYYLIYALRQITYGEDYNFEVVCGDCGKKFDYTLQMNNVSFEELDKKESPIKTIKLPVSKYTVVMKNSTLGEEETVLKLGKKMEDYGESALTYTVRTVEILDDKGAPINPQEFPEFYSALPGKDRATITKAFENIDNLKIPTVMATCPKCEKEIEMSIPFTKDFFRY